MQAFLDLSQACRVVDHAAAVAAELGGGVLELLAGGVELSDQALQRGIPRGGLADGRCDATKPHAE